ncbi:SNF2 family N-terminal domain-containing protein [Hypoxylon trugodes]|uniref:SNF2 family N-terminal domain-containing protein n=1 Tax=Hypoxylon trugodes TaxID=326681 RepID=UPI0021A02312|nr:SNF2 family N-terminal domain-containing protein [Hypoxylon trugodes]KAI1383120.1 SNF2 family N-terminal domain-containing protein [Hypoxylon trugodes]
MAPSKRRSTGHLEGEPRIKSSRNNSRASPSSQGYASGSRNPQPYYVYQQAPPSSLGFSNLHTRSVEEYIDDDAPDATQATDDPLSSSELYGTMDKKIVGVQYYNGVVNPGEKILCRRDPHNPYDPNAIRVDNVMRVQIGHLPAKVALKLAPYIDRGEITLEGVLTGHKDTFDCPIRLFLYGTSDPSTRLELEVKLKADKILKATELKTTRQQAEAERNATMRLNSQTTSIGFGAEETGQLELAENPLAGSEVTRLRGDLSSADAFAMDEDSLSKLPKAHQPESIQSTMLPHQLQGLAWMTSQENPRPPAPGSKEAVQLWKRNNHGNFFNIVSNHITKTQPQFISGGVLADDMGLGKTLQVTSLIMSTGFNEGPTLIVAPVGVMSNWEQQIERHVKENQRPRVFRYHKALAKKSELLNHDIVITTYDKVRIDAPGGPLFSVQWRRVVLDEAHAIRNSTSRRALAAYQLQAKSRWMLTGTPIVNSTKDFLSVLKFLRITGGIEEPAIFLRLIDKPLSNGVAGANNNDYALASQLFQSLTRDLCLRRRKDMSFVDLKLPTKTEYIHRIKFRGGEKIRYDALFTETAELLGAYRRSRSGQGPQIRFVSVLEKLLRLRQLCCHWTLCGGRVKDVLRPLDGEDVVDFSPENRKILQEALLTASEEGEECPICMDSISIHIPVITTCKHRFGKPCITRALEGAKKCPMCRHPLNVDSIMELESSDVNHKFNGDTQSSKTEALEKILKAKLKDPKSKVVVFSQWTSFLNVIAKLLDEMSYKYCRLEGSMTIARRDESIDALTNDPDTRIMLAKLGASDVGLNLVAADTVILVDSWWAPAIEDQAIDRVHRLGQTRETTVWKLVMDGTVEERVLDVQAKKRELVNLAFQDKAREQTETSHLDNVLRLLA